MADRKLERLAWVTCRATRGRDEDEPFGIAALTALGVAVDVVDWDDPGVDWSGYDRVVMRSAWDYPERIDEFTAWLESIADGVDLVNPLPVMRWSMDKHYLAELDAAGIPIIPSLFVEPGQLLRLDDSHDVIVKPAVGAGGRDVSRVRADIAGPVADGMLAAGRSVIVQPVIDGVAEHGEWPMIFLGGEFSHAANKRVTIAGDATDDFYAPEINRPATATPQMRAIAREVIEHVHAHVGPTTYARVDLVLADDGRPLVMEVELVEPSLFLPQHPPAAERLAQVLVTPPRR